jgi:hypothetical protein
MFEREIERSIMNINNTFRILVVTGPRQVGKTTILKKIMPKEMKMVSLDDDTLRNEAKSNPKFFLESYGKPLFIDEIQKAPELFPYLKMEVDNDSTRGQYWLSGSQTFELMKGVSESLAGRVGIIKMNSLTYKELNRTTNNLVFDPENIKESDNIETNKVFEYIFNGGMPEYNYIKGMDRNIFFESYINTYIERDVREIINVSNLDTFKKFMKDLAIRNGKTLNYSDIASDVGVSSHTIKDWISVLTNSRIIYLLESYHNNKIERLTHMPKIVFMDSGLACFLSGFTTSKDLQLSDYAGSFLEAYIVSELIKSYDNLSLPLNITHFRNKETEEIDLILEKNNILYPLEIKKTSSPNRTMIKNFSYLEKTNLKLGNGGIICLYDKLLKIDEKLYYIPIGSVINSK